ncbi:SGNH/GDSL hydrolase family protein [Engelhardtia mirabilis]|uniref:SGNH hydrolase-type esterase domain-containing protein n=1 Tax=Engelhardtia mirabilis TaxID=2528011 RepID=A0A518BID6_9BACT|nr:hypothetical protein Pla133_18140 [Planctomycetes bacterium Pla133]QDV01064.1 hypothetical protein Pla86_18130 [Planctomycetes bacterium Pla86]
MERADFKNRLAAGVVGVALGLFVTEGVASLLVGTSLRQLRVEVEGSGPAGVLGEAERRAAGALTEGPYRLSVDPLVCYEFKADWNAAYFGVPASTDAQGLRSRLGPEPTADAPRIVILGDSVAFGMGVRDDETLAHHLEAILTEAGGVRPIVRTVACPGWNLLSSTAMLRARLMELRPDVVLLVPVGNDLSDSMVVTETGHLTVGWSPATGIAAPYISDAFPQFLYSELAEILPAAQYRELTRPAISIALMGAVTPESLRRYREAAQAIIGLERQLRELDCEFGLVFTSEGYFQERLQQVVAATGATTAVLPVFEGFDNARDRLSDNAHFTSSCMRAMAWRLAEALVDRGWYELPPGAALPPEDEDYVGNRGRFPVGDELVAERLRMDAQAAALLRPRIDMTTGTGIDQVYGGLRPDGHFGISCLVALANPGGGRLRFELEPLADSPGLYPLELAISVNGQLVAAIEVTDGSSASHSVELPPELRGAPSFDVLMSASAWIRESYRGLQRLGSVRLLRIEAE